MIYTFHVILEQRRKKNNIQVWKIVYIDLVYSLNIKTEITFT